MAPQITVVIPVGPEDYHRCWLDEAIESVWNQYPKPAKLLIIRDGGKPIKLASSNRLPLDRIQIKRIPWTLGFSAAFNVGVGYARTERILYLASDDRLLPGAIAACETAWRREGDEFGWYYMGVEYSDGEMQNTPCSAAMITKTFWRFCGGYPPESAVGMPDAMLISALLMHQGELWPGRFYQVSKNLLYWARQHKSTQTAIRSGRWHGIAAQVSRLFGEEWRPEK